jgi:hypothetical protein
MGKIVNSIFVSLDGVINHMACDVQRLDSGVVLLSYGSS